MPRGDTHKNENRISSFLSRCHPGGIFFSRTIMLMLKKTHPDNKAYFHGSRFPHLSSRSFLGSSILKTKRDIPAGSRYPTRIAIQARESDGDGKLFERELQRNMRGG